MNAFDAARLEKLVRALDLAPRQIALAAARLARDAGGGSARRCAVLTDARAAAPATRHAAALLATPIAAFALDDADCLLATLWPDDPA